MAIKKKNTKKPAKKKPPVKKPASKKRTLRKTAVRTQPAAKKVAGKKAGIKIAHGKTGSAPRKRVRGKSETVDTVTFEPVGLGARSGGQAGDLQGLSNAGRANSESVDELLEEGNSFEAEVVKGVEDAGDADEGEVHTHEVPEDDVPSEYLDKD